MLITHAKFSTLVEELRFYKPSVYECLLIKWSAYISSVTGSVLVVSSSIVRTGSVSGAVMI